MYRKHKTFYDDFFKTMYDFFLAGVKSIQKRQTHPNSGCLQAWTADRSHRLQRMVISYLNSWSIPLSTWKSGRPLPEQLIDLTVPPGRVVVCYLNSWSISLSPWKSGPLLPEQLIDLASPLASGRLLPEQLIDLAVPLEEWSSVDHLCEDGAHGPHVDRAGVLRTSQQDLRGAVPQCHNLNNLCWSNH